jgi:hypothetical protein
MMEPWGDSRRQGSGRPGIERNRPGAQGRQFRPEGRQPRFERRAFGPQRKGQLTEPRWGPMRQGRGRPGFRGGFDRSNRGGTIDPPEAP